MKEKREGKTKGREGERKEGRMDGPKDQPVLAPAPIQLVGCLLEQE